MARAKRLDKYRHQKAFLAAFSASGSIITAARWARLHRQTHYLWMETDPDYPEKFRAAESKAARTLEDEAVRRAHHGLRRAVRYKGKIVGWETEYSDTLLLALLKANNPKKFLDRSTVAHTEAEGGSLVSALRTVVQGRS